MTSDPVLSIRAASKTFGSRRALDTVLLVPGLLEYVVTGRRVPSSWMWRRLKGADESVTSAPRANGGRRA